MSGRHCGECTLCCRLLPVVELSKRAGERCQHQRHGKGCAIYPDRPPACQLWSCRWLTDPAAAALSRPDRSHYVIDVMPDWISLTAENEKVRIPVVQVWVDPQHRDAWREPALMAYIEHMADRYRMATILRWSSVDALTVFAPVFATDHQWHEVTGQVEARTPLQQHVLDLDDDPSYAPRLL